MHLCLHIHKGLELTNDFLVVTIFREKTHAHSYLKDDVPEEVKARRLKEMTDIFHDIARQRAKRYIGTTQLVLIEGDSKRLGTPNVAVTVSK